MQFLFDLLRRLLHPGVLYRVLCPGGVQGQTLFIHRLQVLLPGQRPPVGGQLRHGPLKPDGDAVLPQQRQVPLPGDHAAAAGDDQSALFGVLLQHGGLQHAKTLLAVLCENLRNGLAGELDDLLVNIHELAPRRFGQRLADGGLAAARHPDEGHVLCLPLDDTGDLVDAPVLNGRAGEQLACPFCLGHQHGKAVYRRHAQRHGLSEKLRPGGVVHQVKGGPSPGEQGQIHHAAPRFRVHPYGGGVDQDLRVEVCRQIAVIVFPGAGDGDDLSGAEIRQHGPHREAGPAGAEDHALFPLHGHAAFPDHIGKTAVVGVVAVQRPVCTTQNGVDASNGGSLSGQLRAVGDHVFFVGDGHVDAVKFAASEKGLQFLRRFFKQPVFIAAEHPVNFRGEAVPQGVAQ